MTEPVNTLYDTLLVEHLYEQIRQYRVEQVRLVGRIYELENRDNNVILNIGYEYMEEELHNYLEDANLLLSEEETKTVMSELMNEFIHRSYDYILEEHFEPEIKSFLDKMDICNKFKLNLSATVIILKKLKKLSDVPTEKEALIKFMANYIKSHTDEYDEEYFYHFHKPVNIDWVFILKELVST